MEIRARRGVIYLKKNNGIRPAAFFAFLAVLCMPFSTISVFGIGLLLWIGIPFFVCCLPVLLSRRNARRIDQATMTLFVFVAYGFLGYFWGPNPTVSSMYNYLKNFAIALCLLYFPFNKAEKKLLMAGSFISCLIVCWFMLVGSNVGDIEGRTTIAIFGAEQDPNYLGFVFLPTLAVVLYQFMNQNRLAVRITCVLIGSVILYCILKTGSRGAFIGIGALTVTAVITRFKTAGAKIGFTALMALLIFVLFDFIIAFLPEELAVRFTLQDMVDSRGTNRIDIWLNTIKALADSPGRLVLGFGTSSSISTIGRATHNYILQLMLELGIVGTVLFLRFLWIWFKRIRQYQDMMCMSILMGTMALAMSLSVNTNYYFWMTLTLSIICAKPVEQEAIPA